MLQLAALLLCLTAVSQLGCPVAAAEVVVAGSPFELGVGSAVPCMHKPLSRTALFKHSL
jgi:hypothetical protein